MTSIKNLFFAFGVLLFVVGCSVPQDDSASGRVKAPSTPAGDDSATTTPEEVVTVPDPTEQVAAPVVEPVLVAMASGQAPAIPITPVKPFKIDGDNIIDVSGRVIRFWGVNLCSLYPTREQSKGLAAQLAERQVNLVRPHHLLRPSGDWSTGPAALVTYGTDSRTFDKEALDRFDYLNAELRSNGIYLALSCNFSRDFRPGDVEILATSAKDRADWEAAVAEMNGYDWKKAIDLKKMLPTIDERAALISQEFTVALLKHVNPYTGIAYAHDAQVVTLEVINESSAEYAIVCGNRFPDYFQQKLQGKWDAYCTAHGVAPCDIYKPTDHKTKMLRADFLRKLDEDYFLRMKKAVAATGSKVPMTFSNLWRGDNVADMHEKQADWVENHTYTDPLVVTGLDDGIRQVGRNVLLNKPFFIGELNQAEGGDNIQKQKAFRTMLPAAMVSYGLLHDWDGLVWFAWTHGDKPLSPEGTSIRIDRDAHLGEMTSDAMMQDHLRTAGYVFRNGLVAPSVKPVTVWIDKPFTAGDYNGLMRGKNQYKEGWQNIHGFRKSYGPEPADQSTAPWMTSTPENPLVSDTGEIVKDIERRQLTVSAPRTEMVSGFLDNLPPQGLNHLEVEGPGMFVTLIAVALDDQPISSSRHLLISRTMIDGENREVNGSPVKMKGIQKPTDGQVWQVDFTRTANGVEAPEAPVMDPDGTLTFPAFNWNECELWLK